MRAILLALTLAASPVLSHEYWIEPLDYMPGGDGNLQADLVNGQHFEGTKFSFLPQRFARFDMMLGDEMQAVENRIGARPPLDMAPMGEGLHVIAYQSTVATLGYTEWEKFEAFAEHKDFPDILARHRANGFPEDEFTEAYTRFSKALIASGAGTGNDMQTGMETELVALDNPYTDDLSEGLRVQAFYQGEPRAFAQIELFDKAPDGTVTITLHRTDAMGIGTLPVTPGHSYLIDAVVLREASPELAAETGAVWETLWAALTLAVPE